jgi:ABC-type transport system involved in multi-copper enzyme maturation permease subunit
MTDTTNQTPPNAAAKLPEPQRAFVGFSLTRTVVIALNTFVEAIRQKVYNILLVIALVVIAVVPLFREFDLEGAQIKLVLDGCLGAITVLGLIIAVVGTAQLLPREVENRTIYTILAKPVRRVEFLLGKYLGSALVIVMTMLVLVAMSIIVLVIVQQSIENRASAPTPEELPQVIQKLRAQAYNADLIKCLMLIFVEFLLLASITMFFSTFSTSMIFNVVMTALVFFAGSMRGAAIDLWGEQKILMMILAIVPDLSFFNVADSVVTGKEITWSHLWDGIAYGVGRSIVFITAGYLIFTRKEI